MPVPPTKPSTKPATKPVTRLSAALANRTVNLDNPPPVWEGPCGDGPNGGVSQSMIQRFLACRDRFKCYAIDGLTGPDRFVPAIEYGNLWHICEEASGIKTESVNNGEDDTVCDSWRTALDREATFLSNRYPMDRDRVAHCYEMCAAQYPLYLDFWKEEGEIVGREPLLREQVFDVPFHLPYGKVVHLRGKWDGLDLLKKKGLYLYENKTKSQIDVPKLKEQLKFDLQTMFYLVALQEYGRSNPLRDLARTKGAGDSVPMKGVLYNAIRRSQHKSAASMTKKIEEDVADGRGGEWFSRFTVDITPADIEEFKRTFLHPFLEHLCVWYEIVTLPKDGLYHVDAFRLRDMMHWRHPSGLYNQVDETGGSEYDRYLTDGSTVGLVRVKTLFGELQ